jgi:hypothetical protein
MFGGAVVRGACLELRIVELTAVAHRRTEAKEHVVDAEGVDGGETIRDDL